MKKLLSALLLLLVVLPAAAQDVFESAEHPARVHKATNFVKAGTRPYVRVGGVNSDYTSSYRLKGVKGIWGFTAEAGADVFFRNSYVGFKPGLRYITKGARVPWNIGDRANAKVHQQTLELPLDVTMNLAFDDASWFQVALGPYFAYGMGGSTYYDGRSYETFGGVGTMGLRRFDVGVNIECTAVYHHFTATLGGESGFVPVHGGYAGTTDDNENVRWPRNRSFYMSIGYEF